MKVTVRGGGHGRGTNVKPYSLSKEPGRTSGRFQVTIPHPMKTVFWGMLATGFMSMLLRRVGGWRLILGRICRPRRLGRCAAASLLPSFRMLLTSESFPLVHKWRRWWRYCKQHTVSPPRKDQDTVTVTVTVENYRPHLNVCLIQTCKLFTVCGASEGVSKVYSKGPNRIRIYR
jgi:hypothetical protein